MGQGAAACGVVHGPLGEVEVEGPHRGQVAEAAIGARGLRLDYLTVGGLVANRLQSDPLLPPGRDTGSQA
jgi:hypothetical protein